MKLQPGSRLATKEVLQFLRAAAFLEGVVPPYEAAVTKRSNFFLKARVSLVESAPILPRIRRLSRVKSLKRIFDGTGRPAACMSCMGQSKGQSLTAEVIMTSTE